MIKKIIKKKPARNALHSNAGGEMTIDELARIVQGGLEQARVDNESLAMMTAKGFERVDKRFDAVDKRFDRLETGLNVLGEKVDNLDKRVAKIEKDIVRINNILEKNTTCLKRIDEERIFTLSYAKRLEHEIEKIKAHLKIA